MMGDLSENFSRVEFGCRCGCGFESVDMALIYLLERVRSEYGGRLVVLSGCRCDKHNQNSGGSRHSQHKHGKAADIAIAGTGERYNLVRSGLLSGASGIGVAKGFVHLDCGTADEVLAIVRPAMWTY